MRSFAIENTGFALWRAFESDTRPAELFLSRPCFAMEFNLVPRGYLDRNHGIDLPPSRRKSWSRPKRASNPWPKTAMVTVQRVASRFYDTWSALR